MLTNPRENSLLDLLSCAEALNLRTMPVRCDPRSPKLALLPMIVSLHQTQRGNEQHHFVVLYGMDGRFSGITETAATGANSRD